MKSKEELLTEAKLRYPPGTVFNSTGGWKNCVVPLNCTYEFAGIEDSDIRIHTSTDFIGEVYNMLTWAEIISKPPTITKQQKQNILKMIEEI